MSHFRQDPAAGYWVAIANHRLARPLDYEKSSARLKADRVCPFCPGNEALTPPEIFRFPGSDPSAWRLRVVPNKYPAIGVEQGGVHEVIIDSPLHTASFGQLPVEAAVDLLLAVHARFLALRELPRLACLQLFKNNGQGSGASLEHPHSQIIGLPVIPPELELELAGAARYQDRTGQCVFCEMPGASTVASEPGVLVTAPFASRFAFETWILPRDHEPRFENAKEATIRAVAVALRKTVRVLEETLDSPPFNVLLHTAPLRGDWPAYHWHLEVIPRTAGVGGFEFATGCYINTISPEDAAETLKGAWRRAISVL